MKENILAFLGKLKDLKSECFNMFQQAASVDVTFEAVFFDN